MLLFLPLQEGYRGFDPTGSGTVVPPPSLLILPHSYSCSILPFDGKVNGYDPTGSGTVVPPTPSFKNTGSPAFTRGRGYSCHAWRYNRRVNVDPRILTMRGEEGGREGKKERILVDRYGEK